MSEIHLMNANYSKLESLCKSSKNAILCHSKLNIHLFIKEFIYQLCNRKLDIETLSLKFIKSLDIP